MNGVESVACRLQDAGGLSGGCQQASRTGAACTQPWGLLAARNMSSASTSSASSTRPWTAALRAQCSRSAAVAVTASRLASSTVRCCEVFIVLSPNGWLKGAGERATYTRTLNVRGRTKIWLPTFQQTGKVSIRVKYQGDARVEATRKRIAFRVVDRRTGSMKMT